MASLFHNDKTKRKYVLLIDLVNEIRQTYHGNPVTGSIGGGAGRVDQAFAKIKFPNMRETGLADLRDANVLYYEQDLGKNITPELANFPPLITLNRASFIRCMVCLIFY